MAGNTDPRTYRLTGIAYSTSGDVTVTVEWNNTQVYTGTVTTQSGATPSVAPSTSNLIEWQGPFVEGDVPVSISVSGGDLIWNTIIANYSGYTGDIDPVDFFGELNDNTATDDGRTNLDIQPRDGELPTYAPGDPSASDFGEWNYKILNGQTLTCDYRVQANYSICSRPA